jgi:hypothetical protein
MIFKSKYNTTVYNILESYWEDTSYLANKHFGLTKSKCSSSMYMNKMQYLLIFSIILSDRFNNREREKIKIYIICTGRKRHGYQFQISIEIKSG